MNKTELITQMATKTEMTKKDATRAVETILEIIQESLQSGDRVRITGFGNFEVRQRNARRGRNPQTGEEIEIKASRTPVFRAGKSLRESIHCL